MPWRGEKRHFALDPRPVCVQWASPAEAPRKDIGAASSVIPHTERGDRAAISRITGQNRARCDARVTVSNARLYCAPSHLKRVFRDFPAIDGVQKRAILGSSPEAFVVPGYSLKIRIGKLCRDSRRWPFCAIR